MFHLPSLFIGVCIAISLYVGYILSVYVLVFLFVFLHLSVYVVYDFFI